MKEKKVSKEKLLDRIIKTRFVLMIILFSVAIYAYLKWNLYWISQRTGEISSGSVIFVEDIFQFMLINNMCILGGIAVLSIYYFLSFYQKVLIPLYYLEEKIIEVLVGEGAKTETGKGEKDTTKYLVDSLNALVTRFRRKIDKYEISSKETFGKVNDCLDLLRGKSSLSAEEINKITLQLNRINREVTKEEK